VTVGAGHDAAGVDQEQAEPRPPGNKWRLALICLAGTFVVLACYDLLVMGGHFGSNDVTTASSTASAKSAAASKATQAGAGLGSRPAVSAPTAPASQATRTVNPSKATTGAVIPSTVTPSTVAPSKTATGIAPPGRAATGTVSTGTGAPPGSHPLSVTSVAAFGPEGLSDGDNPSVVAGLLNGSADQPWYSQWYATPTFGNLRSGTGLLLDMGDTVTVKSAQLVLGAAPGANVQVLVGNEQDIADMTTIASAYGVGGTVRLTATTPASGRYVLIWFTRLPPNAQGEYQVDVYGVSIEGNEGA
jgi:hypothetical protein